MAFDAQGAAGGATAGAAAGSYFGPVGTGVGAVVGGIAGSLINSAAGMYMTSKQQRRQHKYNLELMDKQYGQQVESAQHAHQWEVQDLRNAGLNPILSAMGSSAGSLSGGSASASLGFTPDFGFDPLGAEQTAENTNSAKKQQEVWNASIKNLEEQNKKLIAETAQSQAATAKHIQDIDLALKRFPEEIKEIRSRVQNNRASARHSNTLADTETPRAIVGQATQKVVDSVLKPTVLGGNSAQSVRKETPTRYGTDRGWHGVIQDAKTGVRGGDL